MGTVAAPGGTSRTSFQVASGQSIIRESPRLRARLYEEVKRDGFVAQVKKLAGMDW